MTEQSIVGVRYHYDLISEMLTCAPLDVTNSNHVLIQLWFYADRAHVKHYKGHWRLKAAEESKLETALARTNVELKKVHVVSEKKDKEAEIEGVQGMFQFLVADIRHSMYVPNQLELNSINVIVDVLSYQVQRPDGDPFAAAIEQADNLRCIQEYW